MRIHRPALAFTAAVLLASCGGGASTSAPAPVTQPAPPLVVTPPPPPPPPAQITLVAGNTGGPGYLDATGTAARLSSAYGIAVGPDGQTYIAERSGLIRRMSPEGVVTTFAGQPSEGQMQDGKGTAARFQFPNALAFDQAGNLIVADGHAVRRIAPDASVTTLAGAIEAGYADGRGPAARFGFLSKITVAPSGDIFVFDEGNLVIRKIAPSGEVSTFSGRPGGYCYFPGPRQPQVCEARDGAADTATYAGVGAMVSDGRGGLYVSQHLGLHKVAADGSVTAWLPKRPTNMVLAGNGDLLTWTGSTLLRITPDGTESTLFSRLNAPNLMYDFGMAQDAKGNFFFAAVRVIWKLSATGELSVVAGQDGGEETVPKGTVGVDADGVIYPGTRMTGELSNLPAGGPSYNTNAVYKITPAGNFIFWAGGRVFDLAAPYDGPAEKAQFPDPQSTATDPAGNVYVADGHQGYGYTIRKITPGGMVSTLAGSYQDRGPSADGTGSAAILRHIMGLAADAAGNVYAIDDFAVRKITPQGVVTTLAGKSDEEGTADGVGRAARISYTEALTVDPGGNVLVVQPGRGTIRRISPSGTVTTIAGRDGVNGYQDGPAGSALFNMPMGIAVDSHSNVYVADRQNNAVRKISPDGVVSTLAGRPASLGILTGPLPGSLYHPNHVAMAGPDRLYVWSGNAVLQIQLP